MRFLEQTLQAVLQLHPVARELVLAAGDGPPQALRNVGDEAEGEFLRD